MAVLKKFNPNTQQWEILQGGVQGLQGPPNVLTKGTVTTTAADTNADFSITGTPPTQVLNMTLPRGAAGGWVDPTLLVATDNLDSLVVSGLYMIQSGSGVRASSNWPLDGFAGYIEVVARGSSYILQRATALRATLGSDPSEANLWYRTKFGSTWSPWRKVPVVGRVDTDIVGAGRPDIAGTMTTEVAALVTAATSGAKFRSTDGPQGAWEWTKRGSTWVCVDGDTGWIDLSSLVMDGWASGTVPIQIRRIGPTAYLTGLVDGAARTGANVVAIPAGFYALGNKVYVPPMIAWNARAIQPLYLANVGGSRRLAADTSAAVLHSLGVIVWPAVPEWPTTLTV